MVTGLCTDAVKFKKIQLKKKGQQVTVFDKTNYFMIARRCPSCPEAALRATTAPTPGELPLTIIHKLIWTLYIFLSDLSIVITRTT